MAVTIEDFMKTASKEQKELLFGLAELAEEEQSLHKEIERKLGPHKKAADEASELKDGQYAQIIREDAAFYGNMAIFKERQKLKEVREKLKNRLIEAVKKYNMGKLGLIQRQYKNYVGENIPDK